MTFPFDFVDVQLFVNVVETQSLTRGAERSHISAPAASARIKKVEEALGVRLFYRTAQGLVPTSSGQTFLLHAQLVLRQLADMTKDLRKADSGVRGNVRVYANTLSMSEFVPEAFRRFMLAFPEVNIDLQEHSSAEIASAVRQGAADIGILSSDAATEGMTCLPYRTEHLVLITARGHPLGNAGPVQFSETLEHHYIGLREDTALHAFMQRAATRIGLPLKLRIKVNNFESLCSLVESGVGLGLIPSTVAQRHAQHLAIDIVALRDPWAVRELKIVVLDMESLSAIGRALINELTLPAAV